MATTIYRVCRRVHASLEGKERAGLAAAGILRVVRLFTWPKVWLSPCWRTWSICLVRITQPDMLLWRRPCPIMCELLDIIAIPRPSVPTSREHALQAITGFRAVNRRSYEFLQPW